jgi:hypothetical protein
MGLETTASYHGKLGRVSILWGIKPAILMDNIVFIQ